MSDMIDAKVPAKAQPLSLPEEVTIRLGDQAFAMPLQQVSAELLASLADDFRARLFQAAGKPDPAKQHLTRYHGDHLGVPRGATSSEIAAKGAQRDRES